MAQMISVDSSYIAAIGHDEGSEDLHVEMKSGKTYTYRGVPKAIFDEFLSAPSKGRFLNDRIKGTYAA